MKPVEGADRLRVLGSQPLDGSDRQTDARRFEQEMRRRRSDTDDDGGRQEDDGQPPPKAPRTHAAHHPALSPNVLHWFRRSIQQGVPDDGGESPVLEALLQDIADGVRAGRRFPGDRWRLTVRLRPEVLPVTEADIACVGGELSVALRTASEDAYRALVDALPLLNAALERRQFGNSRTMVFLIGPEELQ